MKQTYEDKCEIYRKWKYEGYGCTTLGHLYGITENNANNIINLADKHGVEILNHKFAHYSSEFKFKAINRVLNGETITSVSIDQNMEFYLIGSKNINQKDVVFLCFKLML